MTELKVGDKIKAEKGCWEYLGTILQIIDNTLYCRFYVPRGELGTISIDKWKITKIKNFKSA